MTAGVLSILETLDHLSEEERHEAVIEILRRNTSESLPPLSDDALVEIASITFLELDEREEADAEA